MFSDKKSNDTDSKQTFSAAELKNVANEIHKKLTETDADPVEINLTKNAKDDTYTLVLDVKNSPWVRYEKTAILEFRTLKLKGILNAMNVNIDSKNERDNTENSSYLYKVSLTKDQVNNIINDMKSKPAPGTKKGK